MTRFTGADTVNLRLYLQRARAYGGPDKVLLRTCKMGPALKGTDREPG